MCDILFISRAGRLGQARPEESPRFWRCRRGKFETHRGRNNCTYHRGSSTTHTKRARQSPMRGWRRMKLA